MTRYWRDRRGGFALIELMLALMLIAVLAALSLPCLIGARGPAALRVAAFQVSSLLREDRNVAQSAGRSVATVVAEDGRRVISGSSSASVNLTGAATARVIGATDANIRFFADGRSSGGEITISSTNAHYVITVSRDTGAIRVKAE